MNKRTRGLILMVLGLMMLAAGAGLQFTYSRQDQLAGQSADILLSQLRQQAQIRQEEPPAVPADSEEPSEEAETETLPSLYDAAMILRIPSVGIQLPVLDQWSYERLNAAPCRFSGSFETEDLVIMGHSYRSHFRPLRQVQIGDTVELTDLDGTVRRYTVAETESIRGSETDRLPSDYPLTLFTCTADSRHRFLVRCAAVTD